MKPTDSLVRRYVGSALAQFDRWPEARAAPVHLARALFALTHIIVYGAVIPQMWVIKKELSYGHTNHVPELSLALLMVERIEQRLEVADAHPVVNALSMGDVIGLIVRCAGTDMDDVPAFLDTVRERTLRAMAT